MEVGKNLENLRQKCLTLKKENKVLKVEKEKLEKESVKYMTKYKRYKRQYENIRKQYHKIRSFREVEKSTLAKEITHINWAKVLKKWDIKEENDIAYLEHKEIIEVNGIIIGNKLYKYPSDIRQMCIKGLRIKLTEPYLLSHNVTCGEESFHLNADEDEVCIGDLDGTKLSEGIDKIEKTLEIANYDSVLSGETENVILDYLDKIIISKGWE